MRFGYGRRTIVLHVIGALYSRENTRSIERLFAQGRARILNMTLGTMGKAVRVCQLGHKEIFLPTADMPGVRAGVDIGLERAARTRSTATASYAFLFVSTRFIDPNSISFDSLVDLLAEELLADSVIAIATDTVFGLVARAASCSALDSIISIKGRSHSVAMPVIIGERQQLELLTAKASAESPNISSLLDAFWPGPLTLVVPLRKGVVCDSFFEAGTVGVRLPDDARLRSLATKAGPLVATSANKHGEPTLRSGREVLEQLSRSESGKDLAVVLEESSRSSLASTVIQLSDDNYNLIREGAISEEAIAKVFGTNAQE